MNLCTKKYSRSGKYLLERHRSIRYWEIINIKQFPKEHIRKCKKEAIIHISGLGISDFVADVLNNKYLKLYKKESKEYNTLEF